MVISVLLFQFTPLREGRRFIVPAPSILTNFNSRPSARGDFFQLFHSCFQKFQFTPLREGRRPSQKSMTPVGDYFNSRPSARGDPMVKASVSPAGTFQFTPLREGRQHHQRNALLFGVFQFTPLREGRQDAINNNTIVMQISIHAPPRGATNQHRILHRLSLFQFTPLREGRPDVTTTENSCNISIHAPPRGATACRFLVFCGFPFQFTPLREGRRQFAEHTGR